MKPLCGVFSLPHQRPVESGGLGCFTSGTGMGQRGKWDAFESSSPQEHHESSIGRAQQLFSLPRIYLSTPINAFIDNWGSPIQLNIVKAEKAILLVSSWQALSFPWSSYLAALLCFCSSCNSFFFIWKQFVTNWNRGALYNDTFPLKLHWKHLTWCILGPHLPVAAAAHWWLLHPVINQYTHL